MYKRIFLLLLTLTLTVFAMVACGSQDDENAAENKEEETAPPEESETNENNQDNEEENKSEEDTNQTNKSNESESDDKNSVDDETNNDNKETSHTNSNNSASSNDELPEPIEVNEELRDAGVTFTLEDITFKDNHISVSFHASNTRGHNVRLAGEGRAKGDNLGGITLIDDTGYTYRYMAEVEDHRIVLKDGEKVTGTVSFAGSIQDDAESLTLVFNPDESTDRKPQFSFEDIEIKR